MMRHFAPVFLRKVILGEPSISCINERKMSNDFPLFGKTLSPRSVTSGTPLSSKNSKSSWLKNLAKLLRRNLLSEPIWLRNSFRGAIFVRLHLPFPVIRSLRPAWSIFSRRTTWRPSCEADMAAIMPEAPAPMIMALLFFKFYQIGRVDTEYWYG